jgi:antitoxin (DNA-binding transcriptional repressor) of toxin-antitoxin stability system
VDLTSPRYVLPCATLCYMSRTRTTASTAEEPVGVRELRQNLSVYLARLKTGTVFRVTERGRAVALLIPLPEHSSAVERLIASGRASAARHDLLALPRARGRASRKVSEALTSDREDRL